MTEPTQNNGSVFEDDPFGNIKDEKRNPSPEPKVVRQFHARSDVDSSTLSQHHTIGIGHNQATAGDHIHDGTSSRRIGQNKGLAVTGSKAGNAALASLLAMLANVIDFDDTTT